MDEPSQANVTENEDLERVLARVEATRHETERLEQRLTTRAELRSLALIGAALGILAAGTSYWAAVHSAGGCSLRERDRIARVHEARMADERATLDTCDDTSKKESADLAQCQQARARADFAGRMHGPDFRNTF